MGDTIYINSKPVYIECSDDVSKLYRECNPYARHRKISYRHY